MEEMLVLRVFGRGMTEEYSRIMVPSPEWLTDVMAKLTREIDARRRDELEKRLKEIKAQRSTLRTAEEKRAALDDEQAALERQLGIGVGTGV